jgi:hypothetical protein
MVQHITAATSIYYVGAFPPAFSATGPDTLIVDADAYIISTIATAVDLTGTWNIQINGQVEAFELHHDQPPELEVGSFRRGYSRQMQW